ncbi:MAG: arylesterase [Acidobacteria bacterium]|nr:arylesterase [Acidobacteriota bacterium]
MRTSLLLSCLALGCALGWACSAPRPSSAPIESRAAAPAEPASALAPSERRPEIVILGDSLTAGLGLETTRSFPALIQQRLDERGLNFQVVNAGVSGDTSAGGLRRLEWALEGNPRVLVVALGGNDALRGLPIEDLERNLTAIVERGTREGLSVILAGMEAPPNNGPEYTARFRRVYRDLASTHDVVLIPFLLEGVAGEAALNQADGIHPNEEGARLVADTVWRALEPVLKAAAGTR